MRVEDNGFYLSPFGMFMPATQQFTSATSKPLAAAIFPSHLRFYLAPANLRATIDCP
jgi:hypothetical protein